METLLEPFTALFDFLFFSIISPLFGLIGNVLELLFLDPMRFLQFPPAFQVIVIAVLTACLSIILRRIFKVEEKEQAFREQFLHKKARQEDLHLISDWKSREKFAKAMDDDIDEDFNTYLAGRFARYGMVYLLPMFLVLFWLDKFTGYTVVISLPNFGIGGIPSLVVFLTGYILTLVVFFKLRKKRLVTEQQPVPTA